MKDEGHPSHPSSFILHPLFMAYIALYRKYRSQSFGEVIGQEHVTTVLQNALRGGRIAHAYLFCGPRGCGKTSTARLLARALNCLAADGPTPEPCGECDLCVRIREGSALDVIEMDAASETGIDDVREKIIENAKYAPGEARYKVYIIDEVHDLSLKAFDSLLKTIEEPPPHVVFILATTEAHKVPLTVRSRCQRMDFRRATLSDLVALLKRVLEAERIEYEVEAVAAVARAAEGSFRDSLSLLEQALAYTDGPLTAEAVHASVGTIGPQMLDEITRTLASDDLGAAWRKAGEVVETGKDVKQTLVALQGHLRDLLVAGIASGPQALADVSAERFTQLQEQSRWFAAPHLLQMLDLLADAERELRFSNQHRLILERAFWTILPGSLVGREQGTAGERVESRESRVERLSPPARAEERPAPSSAPAADSGNGAASPATPEAALPTPNTAEAAPRFAETIDLDGLRRLWPRVRKRVLQRSKAAGAYFGDEEVLALDGKCVVVGFPNEFSRSNVDVPKRREVLEQALATELNMTGFRVRCVLASAPPESPLQEVKSPAGLDFPEAEPSSSAPARNGGPSTPAPRAAEEPPPAPKAEESPDALFLTLVMDEFDGRLVEE